MFEDENINDELIEYNEPEALPSSTNINYRELGQTKITDFGNNEINKMQYTDYKKAYEKTKFDPKQVKYKEYRNIDELKRERGNISHQMTDEMRHKIKLKEEKEAEKERKRKEKMQQDDDLWKTQFDKLNRLFIKE
jgi:hypothetical protein